MAVLRRKCPSSSASSTCDSGKPQSATASGHFEGNAPLLQEMQAVPVTQAKLGVQLH